MKEKKTQPLKPLDNRVKDTNWKIIITENGIPFYWFLTRNIIFVTFSFFLLLLCLIKRNRKKIKKKILIFMCGRSIVCLFIRLILVTIKQHLKPYNFVGPVAYTHSTKSMANTYKWRPPSVTRQLTSFYVFLLMLKCSIEQHNKIHLKVKVNQLKCPTNS